MENPENKQGDDKTRIQFSSDQNNNTSSQKEDSTRIENNVNSKAQSDSAKKSSDNVNSNVNDTDNNSENVNKINEDLKAKSDDKNKISKGTVVVAGVAAGVVGATAGVAAGVHYSDEIKNAFTQTESNAPESIAQEEQNNAQNQTTETANNTASTGTTENATPVHTTNDTNGANLVSNAATDNIETTNANNPSTLNIEYHDNTGTYEISCIDVNSDGKIDSMTMNAEMVDGTSVSYTATGETLDQLLMGDVQPASQNDYISFNPNSDVIDLNCEIPEATDFPETSSYTIQSGDTLSEIAAQNNTTVEELMAHNPQIDDPNLIYTGHELNIPGQNAEIITSESNEVISEVLPEYDTNIVHNTFDAIETNETTEYAQTDWQSFEDAPVDMSAIDGNYQTAMNETDFDNFGNSDNYFDSSFAYTSDI